MRFARRCTRRRAAGSRRASDVLGVLSLIVWALTVIVTIKYVVFVLRADNKGEGGTLSLMALARSAYPRASGAILAIGICGAALFFGDAIITPAISVLSAVEGLKVVTPAFDPYVVPITLVILAALFAVQRLGTGSVASVFGPVTATLVSGDRHLPASPISPTIRLCSSRSIPTTRSPIWWSSPKWRSSRSARCSSL